MRVVGPGDGLGARDGDGVVGGGAAFGDEQVVVAVGALVDVRAFGPDAARAVPELDGGA